MLWVQQDAGPAGCGVQMWICILQWAPDARRPRVQVRPRERGEAEAAEGHGEDGAQQNRDTLIAILDTYLSAGRNSIRMNI